MQSPVLFYILYHLFQEDKLEEVRLAIKAEGSHPHRKLRTALAGLSDGMFVHCIVMLIIDLTILE